MDELILKKCSICQEMKSADLFSWLNKKNNKKHPSCKECMNQIFKEYREKNREEIRRKDREKYPTRVKEPLKKFSKDEIILVDFKQCEGCLETKSAADFHKCNFKIDGLQVKCKVCQKKYNEANREKINERRRRNHAENPEKVREYNKKFYAENQETQLARLKNWQNKNKDKVRKCRVKRRRDRMKEDPGYKLYICLGNRIRDSIKKDNCKKNDRTIQLTGCTVDELRSHIESQFLEGMTWNNWGNGEGKWNIDHIKPCCSFDLSNPDQQKICFHFSNLRPLWWNENMQKSIKSDRLLSLRRKNKEKISQKV